MKLLFKRKQTLGKFGRTNFNLWGKIELDELEASAVRKYDFGDAILIEAEQVTLMRNAAIVGFLAFLAAYFVLWLIGLNYIFVAIVLGGAGGYFFYHQMRETIYVKDLMHGRYFTCRSVIALAHEEDRLQNAVAVLRQVIETAKHWDGTETLEVPVMDKDEARRFVARLL